MTIKDSIAMDGPQTLAGPRSWRIVAFIVAWLVSVPTAVGVVFGLLWGSAAAYPAMIAALGAVAIAISVRLMKRAQVLTAQRERTIRIERAAATASKALLKREITDPVGSSLAALVDGVDVFNVFLETNTDEEADEHGNKQTVRDVLYATGHDGTPGRWELTGWRISSAAREALDAGGSFVTRIGSLDKMTNTFYRAARIGTEVLVPITAEGDWVGSVGFTSEDATRPWDDEEIQLLHFAAEMIGAYWERRDTKGRLEELLAAKDEFIASVSHEVRTPLTAVLGFAHELDENMLKFNESERSDLIGLIAEQSQEVANIVDDLLTSARTEAGTIVIAPQVVSVRHVIGEVLSSHSGRVDFSMATDTDLETWADPGRVRQVLRNLLTNADRHGGNIVKIHAIGGAEWIKLEVRDNGTGVPSHLRQHVFEPYARAHDGTSKPASVGLGLSVARKLAQMMDGDLELNREDGWTVFTLTLRPYVVEPAQQAVAVV
ncbi:MAG: hypothetical protein GY926_16595 [bacterium]|nr:hypothetical protein [bacterium]MCP4966834.1 hypothetical protein [bacterium]